MNENRVLFKIKMLEKMVFRTFNHNSECDFEKNMLTPTQLQIMEYILFKSKGEVFQKDLEDVLNLRRATVSGVLQTMEKNGLVKRVTASSDARVKKIILDPKAQELFQKREKEMKHIEKIIVEDISEEELEVFLSVLDKMKNNIKKENEKVAERKESL